MVIPDRLLIHTATVIVPSTSTDSYGNTELDYDDSPASETEITGRFQQDRDAERFPDGRDIREQGWTLFTNYDSITGIDRVRWTEHPTGTVTFEVFGPPDPQYGATTFNHGEIPLRILEG